MPVEDCPLHNGQSQEKVQAGARAQPFSVKVRRLSAMVWITVTLRDPRRKTLQASYGEVLVPFPAMVDTGFNESLLIHEWHLEKWVGILPNSAESNEPSRSIHGIMCPALKLDVWLHCLHHSVAPPVTFDNAIKLNVSSGALLSRIDYSKFYTEAKEAPAGRGWLSWFRRRKREGQPAPKFPGRKPDDVPWNTYPHIPLIGMKVLQSNELTLNVDGGRSRFSLLTYWRASPDRSLAKP